ncbi:DedA family protein [Clostridium oryzae]|uniref:VTT domain-containing protein n=1 Tax=Clostridium oryzae TaxID=1450648 RepID=A0A1V4IVZ3_9CLOT|nr:DedA family protein [Clostridium oryzae]OPJ63965.1 hypothetical protein CLORY_08370 [Clostridium oryzae]
MHFITQLLNQYGYLVLLVCLSLELAALPLPGEALMTYCGYIVYLRKMNWTISIIAATVGAVAGITSSYFIGKLLGKDFFEKYGRYLFMNKKRLDKVSAFFNKYNTWIIFLAFFIPGMRHVMGYFCGIIKVPYKNFSISAYTGAAAWTTTFISMGNFLGASWSRSDRIIKYITIGLVATLVLVFTYFYVRYRIKGRYVIENDGSES